MWTPKRVLILLGGFVLFSTLFGFYTHFLGYIDGLPELPERYYRAETATSLPPVPPRPNNDKIFQDAFGDECEELARPIRLFLRAKGLAFATKKFEIDRRTSASSCRRSAPSSMARSPADGAFPEINTVQSEFAYLTLDKPVASLSELNNRKIMAIELVSKWRQDGIKITNNHRTRRNQRRHLGGHRQWVRFSTTSQTSRIWTDGLVTMLDCKTSPPTQGQGPGDGNPPGQGRSAGQEQGRRQGGRRQRRGNGSCSRKTWKCTCTWIRNRASWPIPRRAATRAQQHKCYRPPGPPAPAPKRPTSPSRRTAHFITT